MNLDKIHHIAVQVADISKSVEWYKTKFSCEVDYVDSSWALLKFANISLALSDKKRTSTSLRNRARFHIRVWQRDKTQGWNQVCLHKRP